MLERGLQPVGTHVVAAAAGATGRATTGASFIATDVGSPGGMLPAASGPRQTIWCWHRRMTANGTWDAVLARLLSAPEAAGAVDWSVAVDNW